MDRRSLLVGGALATMCPTLLRARDDDPHAAYRDLFPAGFAFPENREQLEPQELLGQTIAIVPGKKLLESAERWARLVDPNSSGNAFSRLMSPGSGEATQAIQLTESVGSPQRLLDDIYRFMVPHCAGVVIEPDLASATDRGASTFIVLDYEYRQRGFPPPPRVTAYTDAYVFDALLNKRFAVQNETRKNFRAVPMLGGEQSRWLAVAQTFELLFADLLPPFLGQLASGFGWPPPLVQQQGAPPND